MIIQRDDAYVVKIIIMLLAIIVVACGYLLEYKVHIGVFFALHWPVIVFIFVYAVAYGRTFELDCEGCKVRFLFFQKKYLWSEFKTKKVDHYSRYSLLAKGDFPYQNGVILAPFRVRKPSWIRPLVYNWIHPWRFIYFNFYPEFSKSQTGAFSQLGRHYEVDESEFWIKMSLWHVELEGHDVNTD